MNANRLLLLGVGVVVVVCAVLMLPRNDSTPQKTEDATEEIIPKEAFEDSAETESVSSDKPNPPDPLRADVIAKAEAVGLTEEQLQDVRSNAGSIATLARVFGQSIEFYGRVVDLEGNPVANAKITYSAFNRFFENSPAQTTVTDKKGYFRINDIQGGNIYVRVSKDGYYKIEESERRFANDFADDPSDPAILKLRKHGEAEPLVKFGEKWGRPWSIPRNGTAVGFDLVSGKVVSASEGHIIVRAWSPDTKPTARQGGKPYAWKFEISAPRGGFIERTDQFEFIAPQSGYVETLIFEMPANSERWSALGAEEEVFAKLKDDNYARIYFRYRPSSNNKGDSFSLEAYTNPSGSRNLEYDPSLEVPNQ